MRFCENWALWATVGGLAGRPYHCRCQAPTTAGAAATAARRANPHLLTAPCFHRISFYSAKTKQFTQPKRIYSANGNPFMPMIWRFCAYFAPYIWPSCNFPVKTWNYSNVLNNLLWLSNYLTTYLFPEYLFWGIFNHWKYTSIILLFRFSLSKFSYILRLGSFTIGSWQIKFGQLFSLINVFFWQLLFEIVIFTKKHQI